MEQPTITHLVKKFPSCYMLPCSQEANTVRANKYLIGTLYEVLLTLMSKEFSSFVVTVTRSRYGQYATYFIARMIRLKEARSLVSQLQEFTRPSLINICKEAGEGQCAVSCF